MKVVCGHVTSSAYPASARLAQSCSPISSLECDDSDKVSMAAAIAVRSPMSRAMCASRSAVRWARMGKGSSEEIKLAGVTTGARRCPQMLINFEVLVDQAVELRRSARWFNIKMTISLRCVARSCSLCCYRSWCIVCSQKQILQSRSSSSPGGGDRGGGGGDRRAVECEGKSKDPCCSLIRSPRAVMCPRQRCMNSR